MISIGISACLLGDKVRFDGGHKNNPYIADVLTPFFKWVRVCPEVEMGLGTPRESMHILNEKGKLHLKTVKTGQDLTAKFQKFSEQKLKEIEKLELSGFLLKKNSPSCGLERVKVYTDGVPFNDGSGFFAMALKTSFPDLPLEDEGRLVDAKLRENWVQRVFVYRRFQDVLKNFSKKALIEFHTRNKMIILSHNPKAYQELGRWIARGKWSKKELLSYRSEVMAALKTPATPGKHVNVLQHMAGYFKKEITASDREELMASFDDFKKGYVPLIVPVTLIRHYVRKFEIEYLKDQYYLTPHPKELALLNHVYTEMP